MSVTIQEEFISAHNQHRSKVARGSYRAKDKILPPAADMVELVRQYTGHETYFSCLGKLLISLFVLEAGILQLFKTRRFALFFSFSLYPCTLLSLPLLISISRSLSLSLSFSQFLSLPLRCSFLSLSSDSPWNNRLPVERTKNRVFENTNSAIFLLI